ncbi:E3 ubiquitin-protein ligase UPL1-like [Zingiber officinale]|uniref:E3 ubiquitin-protein ligase UPL1-like n=1 Tax=Zingiber officinale TaxID=94328 RepID=UPI001C4DA75F|nr:E3 ubiquitin-protein ligase UPL1-like [Zingiber officinale]
MSGGSRRTARNRGRPPTIDASDGKSHRDSRPVDAVRKVRSRDHGPIRLMDVSLKTLLWLGFGFLAFISVFLLIYNHHWESWHESPALMRLRRVVTPLQASKMMDLAQFQGEHKESLYWGTYRPHVYFGIRARTPQSLIAGLMWISMRNGQYFLRHVCQDSDDLSTYGWKDHNGRSYGRQLIVDHGLSFTTSFLKEKKEGSGFGGDWAVRLDLQNAKSIVHEGNEETTHLFFYIADEEGNSLNVKKQLFETRDATLLAFGTRNDIGGWELHLDSQRHVDTHFSGFRTHHMHNLTELVQGTLAFQARRTGELQLSDTIEESSNVVVIQISTVLPAKLDIAFVSGTNMEGSLVDQRLHSLTGDILSTRLDEKQKEFEDKYLRYFKLKDKVDSELMAVGRAALGNLLGGIGYFYGQSKIALPEGYTQKNGDKFIYYWPAALFTAVPSRSFFPRGFLWDEGFHQMIIGRWDADLSMDIIGHWLDLINADGWIPREQILGAEALSKVPEEFVLQYSTNGNPPTLFLVIRDLLNGIRSSKFSPQETDEITDFLKRAYVRLNAWFQWFNSTQSGNDVNTFYWHGRDNATTKELNPKIFILPHHIVLQANEPLAFPIRDLLVTICSQNNGQHRHKVLSQIIDHVNHSCVSSTTLSENMLSALFHVLALLLHDDVMAREVAYQAGLVKIAMDLLSRWNLDSLDGVEPQVPKWVTACFLSVDQLLQVDPKMPPGIVNLEQMKNDTLNPQHSLVIDEQKEKNCQSCLASTMGFLNMDHQKRLLEICCRCIQNQLPCEITHVVLQLSSMLTKVHPVAVSFLEAGGLQALLSLPANSLFPGYSNVAAVIIRHILEDPNTLQQAMELEIRHSLIAATSRHSNARVSPRTFVQNLSIVISRDPVVFLKAAQAVCRIEMLGDRPNVVLLKDREKEKSKAKDKEKIIEKDKIAASDEKTTGLDMASVVPGNGHGKLSEPCTKNTKAHRKTPQSFTSVIEYLLDLIVKFVPPVTNYQTDASPASSLVSDMDIDSTSAKGKEKVTDVSSKDDKINSQEALVSTAKIVFIVKLLTEILLTYASSIQVLLRRDAELSSSLSRGLNGSVSGGIFHHILLNFLPYPGISKKDKKTEGDWRQKLATRASQFLVASSVRSTEGRRRIFSEISNVFKDFVDSSGHCRASDSRIHAFVDLLNDILAARSPTGSYISAEASVTFIDLGLVHSLSQVLQVLDLDHADSPKLIAGIIKVLELVTKEHVHSAYINTAKEDNSLKLATIEHQLGSSNDQGDRFEALETMSQPDHTEEVPNQRQTAGVAQTYGNSSSVLDDMDHDREMNGVFSHEAEDDFMHEVSEDGTGMDNGVSSVEIRFEISQNVEDDMGDDDEDEDMSGDGEEVDDEEDDDEENNDLEEDEVHQISHPDIDHDDHEIDDEEFDEDVLEEEDDDDEDDDGVILRLEEGISGINVFDQFEVLGSDNFSVMPLDIFGSRRQGRTTSIYNLLGRTGDHTSLHLEHPLLGEPSSFRHLVHQRQSENTVDIAFSERNQENTSYRMDAIFRTLRNGRHGHRFSMWLDDNHQRGASNAPAVPEGIEELLVSQLRQPTPAQDQNIQTSLQGKHEPSQLQTSEAEVRDEIEARGTENHENIVIPLQAIDVSPNTGIVATNGDSIQDTGVSGACEQVTEMQYEWADAVVRDVEAVSQASSGSGATIGESLRSLEVEIGSVDGHDDGDRQGPVDRLPLGDLPPAARMRRSSANSIPVSGRDTSLESVSEIPHQNEETDRDALQVEQPSGNVDTNAIDPTFLEALPEELRAEVLSSRQNQVSQASNEQPQADGDIDPEFLAALPPDIREEVLAQQRAQRQQESQQLEGQPVEMDAVSIIATLPSDVREEVLLTSPDTLLATLTPALVAEANMLRERFAHRHHTGGLFGISSRSRRGESSRHGDTIGSTLDRNIEASARRSTVGKLIETDGVPLVGINDLKAMIRLLRIVQPLYKGQLQRLFLNLCTHHETRTYLVEVLMDMLMLDLRGPTNTSVEYAESPFRLYGCQSYVAYSRPQFYGGVPPLVSRRILETLAYLAKNHPNVSKLLLHLVLPCSPTSVPEVSDKGHGKAVLMEEDKSEVKTGAFAIVLLLGLLNQPLYMRSVSHLEQLLNLIEVVIDSGLSNKPEAPTELQSASDIMQDTPVNADAVVSSAKEDIKSKKSEDSKKASTSGTNNKNNISDILLSIPEGELRLLCSLLAREGLSDNAYNLVAEVLKKVVANAPAYCHLFTTELVNSVRNLSIYAINELNLYEDAEKALLSSSSINGTAILRVLQALSSLIAALHEKKDPVSFPDKDHINALSHVWDINSALEPLWLELSNCISKIEISSGPPSEPESISGNLASTSTIVVSPLSVGAQNILPYIESFFVTCEKLRPGQYETVQDFATTATDIEDATTPTAQKSSCGPCTSTHEKQVVFVRFLERHRKLLNSFIRQNPGLLEKSFSLMLKIPRYIDFDNKRSHFRSKIKHQHDHHHSPVRISVRRAYILEDSYNQLRMRSPQDLKGKLTVHFQGEEGIDAGGLTREWYQLLSRVIFDKGALLFTTVGNESTFQPNPNSVYQTEHLSYFKFVGRVVSKALFDSQLLDVHFTRSFYKHILGVKVTYHDIEAVDPDYYKNLKWMLENDISEVLDLTFSMDADEEKLILYEKAEVTDSELIPGGRNIRVTEENKHEYVDRVAEHLLTTAIRPQINAFMEGFNELIPRDLISIFNDKELELLISGLPDIDLDDLRANTEYSGYSNASPVIQWFWEVVQGFSKEDKARFLQFVTGTSKVPLEGFSALQGISGSQRFQIHKAYGTPHHLPSAHTCFNQLDLPEYTSKGQLQERLLLAIHEANEGFGFG